MQESWVRSLAWKDLLWKGMAIHSSIFLPGESHGQKSLASYSPWGDKESVIFTYRLLYFFLIFIFFIYFY